MRKIILTSLLVLIASSPIYAKGGQSQDRNKKNEKRDDINKSKLTQKQIDDLLYMYEEEKLARDVYITLGNKWNSKVFLNIQKSEQRHMDSVKNLLDKYALNTPQKKAGNIIEIDDNYYYIPTTNNSIGKFKNQKLQTLYNDLIKKGNLSLKDALEVGVLVEETDIADLEEKIIGVPQDIEKVYNNLLKGSHNHLNAFNRNLDKL